MALAWVLLSRILVDHTWTVSLSASRYLGLPVLLSRSKKHACAGVVSSCTSHTSRVAACFWAEAWWTWILSLSMSRHLGMPILLQDGYPHHTLVGLGWVYRVLLNRSLTDMYCKSRHLGLPMLLSRSKKHTYVRRLSLSTWQTGVVGYTACFWVEAGWTWIVCLSMSCHLGLPMLLSRNKKAGGH